MHIRSIAILNCNKDREELEPDFPNDGIKYLLFFKPFFPEADFKIFRTSENEFPEHVEEFDLYFITGSVHAAYDDFEWIRELERFIQKAHATKKLLVGFCFGHQVIAKALGGKVECSKNGWVLGVRNIELDKNQPWLGDEKSALNIVHIHQDQVTIPPPNSTVISGDDLCPNEVLTISNHILTIQGHPEFSNEYFQTLLPIIKDRFNETTYTDAMNTVNLPNEGAIFAQFVRNFCDSYQPTNPL